MLDILQVFQKVDVHRRRHVIGAVGCQDPLDHMVHGQKGKVIGSSVAGFPGQQGSHGLPHPAQMLVLKAHPFGLAGGAGGIAQRRQVAESNRRLERCRVSCPQFQECLPGDHFPSQSCGHRPPAEGDDRQVRLDLSQSFHDFRRADEQQLRPAG